MPENHIARSGSIKNLEGGGHALRRLCSMPAGPGVRTQPIT